MLDFTALDFETANSFRGSPCCVGLARVRDGQVVATEHWLMRPPDGVDADMVADKPRFGDLLPQILEFLGDDPLVAHNAAFDTGVLRYACDWSGLSTPSIREVYCTLVLARHGLSLSSYQLPAVAGHLGVELTGHHQADADADAVAAAQAAVALARHRGTDDLYTLAQSLSVRPGCMSPGGWAGARKKSTGGGAGSEPQVTSANADADPDGYLYGRVVVFTGAPPGGMGRQAAFDAAAHVGAIVDKGVTRRTNVLVVGDLNPGRLAPGQELSGKARKAADLQAKGQDIEVLTGDEFLRLVPGAAPDTPAPALPRGAAANPCPCTGPGNPPPSCAGNLAARTPPCAAPAPAPPGATST